MVSLRFIFKHISPKYPPPLFSEPILINPVPAWRECEPQPPETRDKNLWSREAGSQSVIISGNACMVNGTLKTEETRRAYNYVESKEKTMKKWQSGPDTGSSRYCFTITDLYSGENIPSYMKNMCSFINLVKFVLPQLVRLSLGMPQAKQKAI